jgi:fructokinase
VTHPAALVGTGIEQGLDLMRFASACGALVCQGAGAIDPQPLRAEVVRFLQASGPFSPA